MSDTLRPYGGLNVVDLSQGVAGPHCGLLLAQYGANVVKVEPMAGDWGRAIGRQYEDLSAYFTAFNRGKRSIAVDMKSDVGLRAVRTLMEQADVVIENYRPGVMARFGLDYEALKLHNPDVVYVSITGFGQQGPRASFPATDSILQSYSGLMSVNRDERGLPQRIGVLVIDVVTGLYAYQAAATALYSRAVHGGGRHICTSLMEAIGAVQAGKMVEFHLEGADAAKPGVPVGTFKARDGFVTVNARRDAHYRALCALLGLDALANDARFATSGGRAEHEEFIMNELAQAIEQWDCEPFMKALAEHDVLHARVNDYADYFDDAHVRAVDAVQWLTHPVVGQVPLPRIPGVEKLEEGAALASSPRIGEHSLDVLDALGWTSSEIDAAVSAGAVGQYQRA